VKKSQLCFNGEKDLVQALPDLRSVPKAGSIQALLLYEKTKRQRDRKREKDESYRKETVKLTL
jgi:hypothetical protein